MAQIETFPQQRATAPKPKLTLIEVIRSARTPEEMLPLAAAAFPNATMGELATAIKAELTKLEQEQTQAEGEQAVFEDMMALVRPVLEAGEADDIGGALRILAERGDAKAVAYLEQIARPEQVEFFRLLDLAVAEDPYWERDPDGQGYKCKPDALHQTPEKLVSAYKQSHGLDMWWCRRQQAIQDEANRKRSEATKAEPRSEDGSRLASGEATDSGSTSHSDPANKTSTAKAAASRTNRGAVERMDGLDAKRPDLAAKVRSLARAPFLGVNPHCPDDLVN